MRLASHVLALSSDTAGNNVENRTVGREQHVKGPLQLILINLLG